MLYIFTNDNDKGVNTVYAPPVGDDILIRAMLTHHGDITHRIYLFDLNTKGALSVSYGDMKDMKNVFGNNKYIERDVIKYANIFDLVVDNAVMLLSTEELKNLMDLANEMDGRDAVPIHNPLQCEGIEVTILFNNKIYSFNLADSDMAGKLCDDCYWRLIQSLEQYSSLKPSYYKVS